MKKQLLKIANIFIVANMIFLNTGVSAIFTLTKACTVRQKIKLFFKRSGINDKVLVFENTLKHASLSPIKEAFSEFQFHKKIYPLFFRGNIFSVDDIRNKSAHDLYDICEQDYCLTMKTYYALRKNGVMLCGWNDQYLFEILPQYKSVRLFK